MSWTVHFIKDAPELNKKDQFIRLERFDGPKGDCFYQVSRIVLLDKCDTPEAAEAAFRRLTEPSYEGLND